MATGIVLFLIGLWVVLRSVRKDATGRTLVDRVLGASS